MNALENRVVVSPSGSLDVLSQHEVLRLMDASLGGNHELLRRCSLAVLNCGSETDDAHQVFRKFRDFDVELMQLERGVALRLHNAPAAAFVDGKLIRGIREHLFAVLRDLVYVINEIEGRPEFARPGGATEAVFQILRNAGVLRSGTDPNIVVCWGGHAIGREEYDYSKAVGYELGLRGLDVCTGCGPGAMKGPMKGAAVGHAKQRHPDGRYLGITEPGIIAAEAPNPIVNALVIMPDIEKRLEAFVRFGHGFVVFPGGVGTAEEVLYLLGVLLNPGNDELPFPLVMTGPASSEDYFRQLDTFLRGSLGDSVGSRYEIIVDDPAEVARCMRDGMTKVRKHRRGTGDAFFFNWRLVIDEAFQLPFPGDHESMAGLKLNRAQPVHELAANLRRAFSGIVAGNVKDHGVQAIKALGPFEIHGDDDVLEPLDELLRAFANQSRMRLPGVDYKPCYKVVR
ncbi:MAG: nucleotide 5'-monophosphate nucleosidase PpnN [Gammaproteobacteria bacterium]